MKIIIWIEKLEIKKICKQKLRDKNTHIAIWSIRSSLYIYKHIDVYSTLYISYVAI